MLKRFVLSVFLLTALLVVSLRPAYASSPIDSPRGGDQPQRVTQKMPDDRPDPLTDRQRAMKNVALEGKLHGKAYGKTGEVARGQYVQLDREGEGQIWTVLGEFNDLSHNQIPEPDRSVNNTTIWTADFSRAYYMNMLFNDAPGANSMRNFYIEQSSGRYAVAGDVTDWVKVPGNAASYDDDKGGPAVWQFLQDSVNGWYNAQIAAGKTPEQINQYLSQYDKFDRYDYNGDGNFDQPDGYIDTFQSVHAGEGNEAGGGVLGNDAIWSHSWYAYSSLIGKAGPAFNKLGGIRIGNSNYWIGKYTIQPENGGVGVFAHEYGHDLGLPDLYDTAGGDNSTAFWTLMSSGSWLNTGKNDIGSAPDHMGVWEKFQLGWLNYEVAQAGQNTAVKLGPSWTNTKQAQGLFVVLPPKTVVTDLGKPYAGSNYYYSGSGDNLNNFMVKSFDLPAGATLTAKVRYNIETNWDYAYLVYSTDNGATWKPIQTNLSTSANPNGQNEGFGITGATSGWLTLTADLPVTGKALLGFRYFTDANTGGFGFMVDDISVAGSAPDGAETDAGWTFAPTSGFHVTTGSESRQYNQYYVGEFRQYRGYDATLQTGPYNFGFLNDPNRQNWVEHFPYQDGLLINYWDTSQTNNNTISHPGAGLILPIDAHPVSLTRPDGTPWRNRIQAYDATFGLEPTDALTLHVNGVESLIPSLPANPVFDDRYSYYDPANPQGSVKNPHTGTQIRVVGISAQGGFMQLDVRPAK